MAHDLLVSVLVLLCCVAKLDAKRLLIVLVAIRCLSWQSAIELWRELRD